MNKYILNLIELKNYYQGINCPFLVKTIDKMIEKHFKGERHE